MGWGQTKYSYAVLGNGQRTFAEDGPWAGDDVIVTNRYGRRAGLKFAQPTGHFTVTNAWDAAGRWSVVGGTARTFTYGYVAGSATSLPLALTLPGGGYLANTHDAVARLTRHPTGAGVLPGANAKSSLYARDRWRSPATPAVCELTERAGI